MRKWLKTAMPVVVMLSSVVIYYAMYSITGSELQQGDLNFIFPLL